MEKFPTENIEKLSTEEGVEAIKGKIGAKMTWQELGKDFEGTLQSVEVEEDNIKLEVDGKSGKGTLGTAFEGFSVTKDNDTEELKVSFNAYAPVKNLVIE